jgi:antitoxin component YwqK of YwqJK toxin-antitoxin module
MTNYPGKVSKGFATSMLLSLLFLFACSEKKLGPEDVEYRKDENGTLILYEIDAEMPYGNDQEAFVIGKHPNGKKHFQISFVNGLKDGPFSFWKDNEVLEITGSYKQGKRDGLFVAYGKIGELVYEKTYRMGELDGNFSLYYPASTHDVFRYKNKLQEEGKKAVDLVTRSHLRLKTQFKDGNPSGQYKAFLHPRGQNIKLEDLLKEEGTFNEQGLLSEQQFRYFPRTAGLAVIVPILGRLEEIFKPNEIGFSKAIDEAADEIAKIPAYRNPDNIPAYVYTLDEKGNEIVPIWSSHIKEFAIRNMDGFLLPDRFEPKYEYFVGKAKPAAVKLVQALDLSGDPNLAYYEKRGGAVEVVGLNSKNVIVDVLWSSREKEDVIPLDNRINARRTRIRRSWQEGVAGQADWLLHDGSQLSLRAADPLARFGIDR